MIVVAPTLVAMAEIYALSREGGPRSPRFLSYVRRVEHEWGLSAYNPMAGPAAAETVRALIELDAERLAADAASEVCVRCGFGGSITLAVVVASRGMWTDRLATEVQHRTLGARRMGHGHVLLWADAPPPPVIPLEAGIHAQLNRVNAPVTDAAIVRRESAAEAVRIMWCALHGPAATLGGVLAREGLAYALSSSPFGVGLPADDAAIDDAIAVLGDTSTLADVVGVLYGDSASATLGWTPLGLADGSGFRWAVARAVDVIAHAGPGEALHTTRLLGSGLHW